MPTAALVIDASPIAELVRSLDAVDGEKREALDEIGAAWEASTHARFDSGVAPDGTPWKPSLRALQRGGKTLVGMPRLMGSNTHQVDGNTVEVGTNVEYAAAHQFGVTIKPKSPGGRLRFKLPNGQWAFLKSVTLPARPFLGVGDTDYVTFGEILRDHIARKTGGAS